MKEGKKETKFVTRNSEPCRCERCDAIMSDYSALCEIIMHKKVLCEDCRKLVKEGTEKGLKNEDH